MKSNLTEFNVETDPSHVESVIAWLGMVGFHAFEETQNGVKAYISSDSFQKEEAMGALSFLKKEEFTVEIAEIAPRNWNEEWESSWKNVEIEDFCQIIPSFREPQPGFTHTLIVDPKMAFGTGHHETTRSVMRLMQDMDIAGKKVLDMGCGTGILGILALKMGASHVFAIDIDPWSVENTALNAQLNKVEFEVIEGVVENIPDQEYDIIFANINKNVLLEDIPAYVTHLVSDGQLLLSGFYEHDQADIEKVTLPVGLNFVNRRAENKWVAASFVKKGPTMAPKP